MKAYKTKLTMSPGAAVMDGGSPTETSNVAARAAGSATKAKPRVVVNIITRLRVPAQNEVVR
jgi:hypothetical protein